MKIGVLGTGHIGRAIINGLLASQAYSKENFKIVVGSDSSVQYFQHENFQVSSDWNFLVDCEVIILALRPNDIKALKEKLASTFSNKQIIISVAAGVSLAQLQKIFSNALVARVMPNSSCQFNQSMTMISAESNQVAIAKAQELFNLLGTTVVLSEDKIHTFIAICGSAIAYLYYWLDPLMQLSLNRDLSLEDSKAIISGLLDGAAASILHSKESLQDLQNQVTVPNGTTIEAIKIFDQKQIKASIAKAIEAVEKRSKALE